MAHPRGPSEINEYSCLGGITPTSSPACNQGLTPKSVSPEQALTPPAGDRQHVPTDQAAPDRVFITWPNDNGCGLAFTVSGQTRTEYIRADLVEAADMAECAAFFAGYDAGEEGRADLAAPSAPAEDVSGYGWACTNCRTSFRSDQQARKANDTNGGPVCPGCKGHGQYTFRNDLHSGDPCVRCGISHDDVPSGPCVPAPAEVEGLVNAANTVLRDKLDEIEAQIGRECRDRDVPIEYRKLMWALARLDQRKEGLTDA